MPNLIRRDPFQGLTRDFANMRELMDRLLDDSFFRWSDSDAGTQALSFPIDVSEKENEYIVRASVPGVKRDDIDVELHENVLTIRVEHDETDETKGEQFYRRERRWGAAARTVQLPGVSPDANIDAELKHGVLTLRVPMPETARPKQIEIREANGAG